MYLEKEEKRRFVDNLCPNRHRLGPAPEEHLLEQLVKIDVEHHAHEHS